jgi:hypothetical protein
MSNVTHKMFTDNMGGTIANTYIGKKGEIFYDRDGETPLRLSDGVTPGGIPFAIKSINQQFDPQFKNAGNNFSIGAGTASGSYVLQGLICHFRVNVQFAPNTSYGTTQFQITLPFPSASTVSIRGGTLHMKTGTGAPSKFHIAGTLDINDSTTIMPLYYFGGATDLEWKYNTPGSGYWASTGDQDAHFDLSGAYEIAS